MSTENVRTAADYMADKARRASVDAQDAYADAREAIEQRMGDFERQIRDRPVQSVLLAAGAGFLLGLLLTR